MAIELQNQVIELIRYYTLWWYFVEKENAVRYAEVERNYPDFFITLADSLRAAFIVTAYRLFDKRNDVTSFHQLLRLIETDIRNDPGMASQLPAKVSELQAKLTAVEEPVRKITCLRHNVVAHRNRFTPPAEWFKIADITPREIETVVRAAEDIILRALGAEKLGQYSYPDAVRCDAHSLMQLLEKHTR
jgi:hypothetical protein